MAILGDCVKIVQVWPVSTFDWLRKGRSPNEAPSLSPIETAGQSGSQLQLSTYLTRAKGEVERPRTKPRQEETSTNALESAHCR